MKVVKCLLFLLVFAVQISGQENTAVLCADGIDNDNDGQIDCDDSECSTFISGGCDICSEGISFADYLIEYKSGCNIFDSMPEGALGLADYQGQVGDQPELVFLGNTGYIKLGFSNNLVTNSGDNQLDIWVFEVGTLVEAMTISLRPKGEETMQLLKDNNYADQDGDGFYEMLDIGGALSGIDIDELVPGQFAETLLFDAIQITDVEDVGCIGSSPGADIDAVCAIFYIKTDCNCIPNGTAIFDSCGICLEPTDPEFNIDCMDCNGDPEGTAVVDDCGVCLEPSDPEFNQSCLDCNGEVNGTALVDDCGLCLEPTDLNFNMDCLDCNGEVNGLAIIDDCGQCLEPMDPNFNQSCVDCAGVINGTSVIDDCGECIESSSLDFNQSCLDCNGVVNGLAVIDDCGECLLLADPIFNQSCIDCLGVINGNAVLDECNICLEISDPNFNQSCIDCTGTPNGNAEIDGCGNCLEPTDPNFKPVCNSEKDLYIPNVIAIGTALNDEFKIFAKSDDQIINIPRFTVYDRWGNIVYNMTIDNFANFSEWWDGRKDGIILAPGCYVYQIQVLFADQTLVIFVGDVTLIR
jgi:hypothetical protein